VTVALAMKAMPSGGDQARHTTGADAHRGPAENGESGCDTWVDKRLMVMRTLKRYSSIASRGQYGLNADGGEEMLGGYQRTGIARPEPPGYPRGGALPGTAYVRNYGRHGR